jgi:hypothetical protein
MATHDGRSRRGARALFALVLGVIALGTVGLFTAMVQAEQTRGQAKLAQAELAKTSLQIELERELDAERIAHSTTEGALAALKRQLDAAQRALETRCAAGEGNGRTGGRPHAVGNGRPGAAVAGNWADDLTELPPYVQTEDSPDGIDLKPDKKKNR